MFSCYFMAMIHSRNTLISWSIHYVNSRGCVVCSIITLYSVTLIDWIIPSITGETSAFVILIQRERWRGREHTILRLTGLLLITIGSLLSWLVRRSSSHLQEVINLNPIFTTVPAKKQNQINLFHVPPLSYRSKLRAVNRWLFEQFLSFKRATLLNNRSICCKYLLIGS